MLALFPEIIHIANAGNLEALACLVRKYFADRQIYAPRLQVEPLLINAGFDLSRDSITDAARLLAADHRGAWYVSLVVNSSLRDPREMNFTLAHLFGHFLCDFQPMMARGELQSREYRQQTGALSRYLSKSKGNADEARADAFANALLLPKGMVKKAYETLGSIADAAAFFNVRTELMERRLKQLNLRSDPMVAPPAARMQTVVPPAEPLAREAAASSPAAGTSSLVKAQKSLAALNYRREEESVARAVPKASLEPKPDKPEQGLRRLRAIARKIDKSVDV